MNCDSKLLVLAFYLLSSISCNSTQKPTSLSTDLELEKQIKDAEENSLRLVKIEQLKLAERRFQILDDSIQQLNIHNDVIRRKRMIRDERAKYPMHKKLTDEMVRAGEQLKSANTLEEKKNFQNEYNIRLKELKDFENKIGISKMTEEYLPKREAYLKILNLPNGRTEVAQKLNQLRQEVNTINDALKIDSLKNELRKVKSLELSNQNFDDQ